MTLAAASTDQERAGGTRYTLVDAMPETQAQQLSSLRDEVASIKAILQSYDQRLNQIGAIPTPTFPQRNPVWYGVIISLLALICGPGSAVTLGVYFFNTKVDERVELKLKDHKFDEMSATLNEMKGQLKQFQIDFDILLGKRIKQSAALSIPDLQRQLTKVNGELAVATRKKLPASPATLNGLKVKLISMAQTNPEAWNTTLQLASYATALNSRPTPGFIITIKDPLVYGDITDGAIDPGHENTTFYSSDARVAKQDGAMMQRIGQDFNANHKSAPAYIVGQGGTSLLDGLHARKVIFENVHIVYNGGPTQMEDVTFVNCTFSIAKTPRGEMLMASTIGSPSVSFGT